MRRLRWVSSVIGVMSFLVVLFVDSPARASCGLVPPLDEAIENAPAAFVGTIVDLENLRRWATVEVSDVWKGEVDPLVEVRGGPADPKGGGSVVTSVDRHFRLGVTYLFVPHRGQGDIFRDNACSATTGYDDELLSFRPGGAADPTPSPIGESPRPSPSTLTKGDDSSAAWVAGGFAVVLGGLLWFVIARRGRIER